ncbi:MAG: SUMF1/EgtB/PvdO family nonheme iron enzyme [Burkholderiales bacterium]
MNAFGSRRVPRASAAALLLILGLAGPALAMGHGDGCPVNMVPVGPLCMDTYEASVWSKPPAKNGKPRGRQYGREPGDYPCSIDGNDCAGALFAASVPGVIPAVFTTWFQAQQACLSVGKRLPTNAEWQGAAAGTPDTGDADDHMTTCNTEGAPTDHVLTGSRKNCVSNFGVFDMVGNASEIVADWLQGGGRPWRPTENLDAPTDPDRAGEEFGQDIMRGINPAPNRPEGSIFPSMIIRGGMVASGDHGEGAGVFALSALASPVSVGPSGFRCVQ